jgi:hypothetical protein
MVPQGLTADPGLQAPERRILDLSRFANGWTVLCSSVRRNSPGVSLC